MRMNQCTTILKTCTYVIKRFFSYKKQNNNKKKKEKEKEKKKKRKFHHKNFDIFAQNIDCGYTLEPPRQGGSKKYPQSMFWIKIKKKKRVYPCIPQFCYIKVGDNGVYIVQGHVVLLNRLSGYTFYRMIRGKVFRDICIQRFHPCWLH